MQKTKKNKRSVVLVTGASSGIGNSIASRLAKKGYVVYGTSRNADKYQKRVDEFFEMLYMDASNYDSIKTCIQTITKNENAINAIICCAGFGIAGPIEETPITEAIKQLDVNFFGVARIVHAALPFMRPSGGRIIVIGSMAGLTGLPFQAYYSASKFALEGFVESLRLELHYSRLEISLVDLGDFNTGFTQARQFFGMKQGSYYEKNATNVMSIINESELNGEEVVIAARFVHKLLLTKRLKPRYLLGPWHQHAALIIKKIMPQLLFEKLMAMFWGMHKNQDEN